MAANGNASDAHTTRQVRVVFMFLSLQLEKPSSFALALALRRVAAQSHGSE
jgi:hypothetical protein